MTANKAALMSTVRTAAMQIIAKMKSTAHSTTKDPGEIQLIQPETPYKYPAESGPELTPTKGFDTQQTAR
jgi:hypothetical protein